jgi:hypothetical protein
MDILQRLSAGILKRLTHRAKKRERQQRRVEGLRDGAGTHDIFAPEFDPQRMVDANLFLGSQKGLAQPVTLQGYDFPSDDEFDKDRIVFERKRSIDPDGSYQALGAPVLEGNVEFPLVVTMPADYMNDEGTFDFRFTVYPSIGGEYESPPTRVTLDWTPPAGVAVPGKAEFPFARDYLVTSAYLAALPAGELIVTIPAYADRESTDKIAWAWLSELPDGASIPPEKQHIVDLRDDHKVIVPVQVIEAAGEGNGQCYFVYVLFDRAQNLSRLSDFEPVRVSLGAPPRPVGAPSVPLAEGPDGLTYADIAEGVEVMIPLLTDFRYSDSIVVTWGSTELPRQQLGSVPGGFPFPISVPPAVMRAEYEQGGSAKVPTPVSYAVWRGVNSWPSNAIQIDVDFTLIGPPNPDWPDPINPDLPKITVTSSSGDEGVIEGEENVGEPAMVTFELYGPVNEDASIQLYWKNVAVGQPHSVTVGDIPGTLIQIEVPWEVIRSVGDDLQLPVQYSIRAVGGLNELRCIAQPVRVLVVPIFLEAPSFPQTLLTPANPDRYINCDVARLNGGKIFLKIPYSPGYVSDGVEVRFWWKGFKRKPPTPGMTPGPGDPVPESDFDGRITWSANADIAIIEPASERLFTLHPADSGYGFCECYYTIEVNGRTVTSDSIITRVAMGTPNGLCQYKPGVASVARPD